MSGSILRARLSSVLARQRLPLVGAFVISVAALVTYQPALGIGFFTDDYLALDAAGRIKGLDYLAKFFDPRLQRFWYRPMVGLQWKLEYILFRGEATGYHFVQVIFHLVNCLLLYALVTRISRRWRLGFVAGLVYATLALASMTVYWTPVHDPLAGVFALLAVWFWILYLESGRRWQAVSTAVALAGALLSKEVSAVLPVLLFLVDRLVVRRPATISTLFRRYLVFGLMLMAFAALELVVMTRSVFTQSIGYSAGPYMGEVLLNDLSWLALPWDISAEAWVRYAALAAALAACVYLAWRRERRVWLLAAAAVLPVLVIAPIPPHLFNPRYLYLPLMASAIGLALLLNVALKWSPRLGETRTRLVLALVVAGVTLTGSLAIQERVENFGGFIRTIRMQFRPIYERHASFGPDAYLYFMDTPLQAQDISGLLFLRYGPNVTVGGADQNVVANLRGHQTAYVYYLDDGNMLREQAVQPDAIIRTTPAIPAHLEGIVLEDVVVPATRLAPGESLIVLMFWRAGTPVITDYSVCVHLLDAQHQVVAGADSQPRRGLTPTSGWRAGRVQPDGIVVPIDPSVPPGNYTLELGLYDPKTMDRLSVGGADSRPLADEIIIGPIEIAP